MYNLIIGHEIVKIAHRDISLGNLLINDQNLLKLCDFGSSISFIKNDGDMVNSLIAMSNYEIWKAKSIDIYQMGLILYHMIYKKHYIKER